MSNWYKWDSIEDFNSWHESIKTELGLPLTSVDIEGDEISQAIITDSYTQPFIVSDNDVRAMVEPNHATNLTMSENPYKDERV